MPRPLAPLPPRDLVEGDLPVPLDGPLGEDCLPPDRFPLPFAGARYGGEVETGWGASRKASVTRISQSSSWRGMKAATSVSCTSESRYPSESCRRGTSWVRDAAFEEVRADGRPMSWWRTADCRRWKAMVEGELYGDDSEMLILRWSSSRMCLGET